MHTSHKAVISKYELMGVAKGKSKDEYREESQKFFLGIFLFIAIPLTIEPPSTHRYLLQ